MVKMFKRNNGKLYLEYEAYGKSVQKSTRLLDTPKNRTLINKEVIPALEARIISGEFAKEKPKTFSYYSEIYLKSKQHLKDYNKKKQHVTDINMFFGEMRIDKITRGDVKDWVQMRLDMGNSPKTVKNYLVNIRGTLHEAIDREIITQNVALNIKMPSHKPKEIEPFSSKEVQLLLSEADKFFKLYLSIGFYTGMRMGEIIGLQYDDFDFENKVIHVKRSIYKGKVTTPKTDGSIREIPLFDELMPYLSKQENSIWLFQGLDGSHLNTFGQHNYEGWAKLLRKCGLKYRKPGSTRHTFIVSLLKNSDLSILEIAQMAGHMTTQMIIKHYGKYIKGEHLKVDRKLKLFTDKTADNRL
ncbi:site-specific integrase [Sulfurovum sp. TSL1]|uniref:tyrosine-type recombinase/integrase n=1 Tax=Sulfurovum sp. TSL1 TaxID=2826994 RepID=UPI001CC4F78A|nr:site-specific integrase [Sulfurovum sp. TSL1]GIT98823.1 ICEBs1 integrase [Sulfurovum sp. TSL1]